MKDLEMVHPVPQGLYVAAVRHGDLIFTAGITPRKNGILQFEGRVPADAEISQYREAAVLTCANALQAACTQLVTGESVSRVLSLTIYIASEPGFVRHTKLAGFASEFLSSKLGESGLCARVAVGVETLPANAPIEIQLIASIGTRSH